MKWKKRPQRSRIRQQEYRLVVMRYNLAHPFHNINEVISNNVKLIAPTKWLRLYSWRISATWKNSTTAIKRAREMRDEESEREFES